MNITTLSWQNIIVRLDNGKAKTTKKSTIKRIGCGSMRYDGNSRVLHIRGYTGAQGTNTDESIAVCNASILELNQWYVKFAGTYLEKDKSSLVVVEASF